MCWDYQVVTARQHPRNIAQTPRENNYQVVMDFWLSCMQHSECYFLALPSGNPCILHATSRALPSGQLPIDNSEINISHYHLVTDITLRVTVW